MSKKINKCKEIIKPSVEVFDINTTTNTPTITKFRISYLNKCNSSNENLQLINFCENKQSNSVNFKDFTLHHSKKDNTDITIDHISYINYFKNIIKKLSYNFKIKNNYIISGRKRYHIREIHDIYDFYEKHRNKNNLKYFKDQDNSVNIPLNTNFNNDQIKPGLKINQVMLIYFHKKIINWYKDNRTGLDIYISPIEFIQMCLLPVFRPFIITYVRTKFSEFYKKNIELMKDFEVLDNMYSTYEKDIDMIHRVKIDNLLKEGRSKIDNEKRQVLNKFDEFSKTVDAIIININKYIDEKKILLLRFSKKKTYLHDPTQKYSHINFFHVLTDPLQDIYLLQKDIEKFTKFKKILSSEQQSKFNNIVEKNNIIKKQYKELRKLNLKNKKKNYLLNGYIYDNIKKNFSIMFIKNSLDNFKSRINVTLNDLPIKINSPEQFKNSLNRLFSTKDGEKISNSLNFSYKSPDAKGSQPINFQILKKNLEYNSYKTYLIFPKNILDLQPKKHITHKKNDDHHKSSFELTIKLKKEEFNIKTIINKKKSGKDFRFEIKDEQISGYSAIDAYIKYLLEIYIIKVLNNEIGATLFKFKPINMINMINSAKITLNNLDIFETDNYRNTFIKDVQIDNTKDVSSRKSTSGTRSQQLVPNNRSLEAIDPLHFLSNINTDKGINQLLQDTDLNHYHKLYLLLCIFYSLKKEESYSTIFFIIIGKKKKKSPGYIDYDYDDIPTTINKIKDALKAHSCAPTDISLLMTEYLHKFKSITYKKTVEKKTNNKENNRKNKRNSDSKSICLFNKHQNGFKNFANTAIGILYKYNLNLSSELNQFYDVTADPAIEFKNYIIDVNSSDQVKENLTLIKNFVILLEHVQFGSLPDSISDDNKIQVNNNLIRTLADALQMYIYYNNNISLVDVKKYIKKNTSDDTKLSGIADNIYISFAKFFKEDNQIQMEGGTVGRYRRRPRQKQKEIVLSEFNYLRLKNDIEKTNKFYQDNKDNIKLMVEFINNLKRKSFEIFKFKNLYEKIEKNKTTLNNSIGGAKKIIPEIYRNIFKYNLNEKFNFFIDKKSHGIEKEPLSKLLKEAQYKSYSYYPDVIVPITKCLSDLHTVYEIHKGTRTNHEMFIKKLKMYKYIYKNKLNIYKIYYDNKVLYSEINKEGINMNYNYKVTNKYLEYIQNKFKLSNITKDEFITYVIENIPTTYTDYSNLSDPLKKVISIFLKKYFINYNEGESNAIDNIYNKLCKYVKYLQLLTNEIEWVFIDIFSDKDKNNLLSDDIKKTIIDNINNNNIFTKQIYLDLIFNNFDTYEKDMSNMFSKWVKDLITPKFNDLIDKLIKSIGQKDNIFNKYKESIDNLNIKFDTKKGELDTKCNQYRKSIGEFKIEHRKNSIDKLYIKLKNNNIDNETKINKEYNHIKQLVNVKNTNKVKILKNILLYLENDIEFYKIEINKLSNNDNDSISFMTLERKKILEDNRKKLENKIKIYIDKLKKMNDSMNIIDKLIIKIKNIEELILKSKEIWSKIESIPKINKKTYNSYINQYDVTRFNNLPFDLTKYAYLIEYKKRKTKFKKITSISYKNFCIVNEHYDLVLNHNKVICYSIFNESIVLSKISNSNQINVLEPIKIINTTNPTNIIDITDTYFKENAHLYIDFLFLYHINKLFPKSIFYFENAKGDKKLYLWDSIFDETSNEDNKVNRIVTNLKSKPKLMTNFTQSQRFLTFTKKKKSKKKKKSTKNTQFKYKFQFIDI